MPAEIMAMLKGDRKQFSKEVTQRFLLATNFILGVRSAGKTTQSEFCKRVGIAAANLTRLRLHPDTNFVTVEQCCELINQYQVSASWLLMGIGEMFGNTEVMAAYQLLNNRLLELEQMVSQMDISIRLIKGSKK